MALTLIIGNKNYSSWSMRPWVLMKQFGIPFTEQRVRFDSFEIDSEFKKTILSVNPTGKVPVLIDSALREGQAIWDTLAICEYLAETYLEHHLWPVAKSARAHARSLCAEMHSGFINLRSHCPMNIEAQLPEIGDQLMRKQAGVGLDLNRFISICQNELKQSNGPMLFGEFRIADAFFAPICMRIRTYALPVPTDVQSYIDRVSALPSVFAWINEALAEKDFLSFEEPYRTSPQ